MQACVNLLKLDLETGAPLPGRGQDERRGGEILDGDADRLVQSNFDRGGSAAPAARYELSELRHRGRIDASELGRPARRRRKGRVARLDDDGGGAHELGVELR